MKKTTLGLAVIYAGGSVSAALQAAEKAGVPVAMDDLMASRLSVQRPFPATITRVIDDNTVDLELQGVPADQPRQRFAVKFSAKGEPGTFNFTEVAVTETPTAEPTDFESMTVADLKDYAEKNNVEIEADAKKADINAAIKKAQK